MKKVCSIYRSPVGLLTIANDGFYITDILFDNHSCDFLFDQNNTINNKVIQELKEYFEGTRKTFDLPLKFEGSDFQKKVWNAITKIPYGETSSYGDIAEAIGKPTAVRAIGMANAKNPIAIVVPSHRVVTASGSLAGYNGGVYVKKKLIDLEKSTLVAINQKLISQSRASSELLSIALQSTNIYEFYYYPNEKRLVFPERTQTEYKLPASLENAPESFFDEFVHPQDSTPYFDMYDGIKRGEQIAEGIYRNSDGSNWYKVVLSVAETDQNGNPSIVVGISIDITEQKERQIEVNNLIEFHNEVLASMNDMFIGIHRVDLINGTVRTIKGITYSNFEDFKLNTDYNFKDWVKALSVCYHPNDRQRIFHQFSVENILKHRDAGEHNIQETYRRSLGSYYCWISNNIIVNNSSFSNDVAIVLQLDISDQYQQSNILHALCNEYYFLCYINLNEDTYEILRMNDKHISSDEFPIEGKYSEILKRYVNEYAHPDDIEEILKFTNISNLKSTLIQEDSKISCVFRKRVGNHYEWNRIKFTLNQLDNNNFVTLALKNVDDVVRAEMNKKQLLQYSIDKAENANRAKNDFLSRMSHEIRNPMVSIMGLTTLARANVNNPEYLSSCLEKISISGQELLSTINGILDMSQIENGEFNLVNEEFSLYEFTQSSLDSTFRQFKEKGMQFSCIIIDVTVDRVIGDKSKLYQLISNLLSNAFNYTNFGGIVNVYIRQLPITNDSIVTLSITIQDNGIGIKENEVIKIFQAFERSSDPRVQSITGSGLGLTIASNIAHLMDGQISVESTYNNGSTFTANVNLKIDKNAPKSIPPRSMGRLKVLVVNRNEVELKNVCHMLNNLGIVSTPMYLGKDVIKELVSKHQHANDYDAIIVDKNNVPDVKYSDILEWVHAYMGKKSIRVLLSSYDYYITTLDKERFGIDNVISKPLFQAQLEKVFCGMAEELFTDDAFKTKPLLNTNCLLIDDDSLHQQINSDILKLVGSNVEVSSAEHDSIVQAIGHSHFDYIVLSADTANHLDYTFKTIRLMDTKVPVIATTSYYSHDKLKNLIDLGATSHLVEPLDANINLLVNTILKSMK